jgi:hypothetical protein
MNDAKLATLPLTYGDLTVHGKLSFFISTASWKI